MSSINKSPTLRSLIIAMAGVAIAVGATAIYLLYRAAYWETLVEVENTAVTVANLIESVARSDQYRCGTVHPEGSLGATLSQLGEGLLLPGPSLPRGEIIFGRREGNQLLVFHARHGEGLREIKRVPFDGRLAQPLIHAVTGQRGGGELVDYAGRNVLAGYAPIPSLGMGVVYKIELREVNAPFIRAGLWATAIAGGFIVLGAVGFILLIRPLQKRMYESERRASALLAASPVGVFETDAAGSTVMVNERWASLAGMSIQSALGNGWIAALHPKDRDRVLAAWLAFVDGKAPFSAEYRFRRPDGYEQWVFGQATQLCTASGQVTGYTGTITDIDEAVRARTLQAESQANLREAQRLAQLGSWALDLLTNKLSWSDEVFRIFEVNKEQFGASYEAFLAAIHPDDRDMVSQAYSSSLKNRQTYQVVHRLQMSDGSIKWVEERCKTTFDEDGKPLRSAGTVQDITRVKLAEEQLAIHRSQLEVLVEVRTRELVAAKDVAERASKAKSEFLSRMSHELRTPMNAILGFAQILEMENLPANQDEYVREIHKAGAHLLELINELLDLSCIEAGKLTMVIGVVGVHETVTGALQLTLGLISQRRIRVVNQCDADVNVLADRTRFKQILVNLLSNAAKYNRAGGSIRIDSQLRGDRLRLSIVDTGPGIAPERLGRLFHPFERLGAEESGVEGVGIGLALSFKMAELMGAKLGVDSTLGQGSTFWVDLPHTDAVSSVTNPKV